jgi:hypothetical protein
VASRFGTATATGIHAAAPNMLEAKLLPATARLGRIASQTSPKVAAVVARDAGCGITRHGLPLPRQYSRSGQPSSGAPLLCLFLHPLTPNPTPLRLAVDGPRPPKRRPALHLFALRSHRTRQPFDQRALPSPPSPLFQTFPTVAASLPNPVALPATIGVLRINFGRYTPPPRGLSPVMDHVGSGLRFLFVCAT